MEPVDSEGLVAVGYDPEKEQLYLRFLNSDDIYVYYEVPSWVHVELMQAESLGAYVNQQVKPCYECRKL